MDPEVRDALTQVTADLRGEVRASEARTREALDRQAGDLRGEIRAAVVEMRRHFDVVAESLRGDIQGIAEGLAVIGQRTGVGLDEQSGRTDRLEGKVLGLEVRVSDLEHDRKARRRRRSR